MTYTLPPDQPAWTLPEQVISMGWEPIHKNHTLLWYTYRHKRIFSNFQSLRAQQQEDTSGRVQCFENVYCVSNGVTKGEKMLRA